jgi:hypothetical protein
MRAPRCRSSSRPTTIQRRCILRSVDVLLELLRLERLPRHDGLALFAIASRRSCTRIRLIHGGVRPEDVLDSHGLGILVLSWMGVDASTRRRLAPALVR